VPRRDPWVYIGLFAYFALLFVALFGERIAPHEAIYFVPEHGKDPRPYDPGLVFPFGSDILGRDLFSVVLAGARLTLVIVTLGGLARVLAGVVLAVLGSWSRSARLALDGLAGMIAAVPATLVVLLIVLIFVRGETTFVIFIGALLVTGWAGPYRVFRAELDRLGGMPFTEGAAAIGVGRLRVLARHHLPHLVPLLAMNLSQQVVASLVALAELGVLGVFVGTVRQINIELALSSVHEVGQVNTALIADPPEWGGLLANARTIDSLWTTRWLFLVPGVAFATAAVAVAAIGFSLSRTYARRNLFDDLRGPGAFALAGVTALLILASTLVPERYPSAREWASAVRADATVAAGDTEQALHDAGLRPLGPSYSVEADRSQIVRGGPATVTVGGTLVREGTGSPVDVRAFVDADTGGGRVDAPLVWVGRGISPSDYPPRATSVFAAPDFGTLIAGFADDYAGVDVRGKVVVFMRLMGASNAPRLATGPDVESSILNATKRGAAAVLFIDPDLPRYVNVPTSFFTPVNPYRRLEAAFPAATLSGVPVVVLSKTAADQLLAPVGIATSSLDLNVDANSDAAKHSSARELGVRATIDVPLQVARGHVRSWVAEVPGIAPDSGHVLVWAVKRTDAAHPAADVAAALARQFVPRRAPFIFTIFDPSVDSGANARDVAALLAGRRIRLILVLDGLDGDALRFETTFGDLIPAFDLYADKAGATHLVTKSIVSTATWTWPGRAPFIESRAVLISGTGGTADRRADAAAVIGYFAGRMALGAEEVPR
jgi:peptide/nickel transport system permease protein